MSETGETRFTKQKIKSGEWWTGECLEMMQDIPDGSVDMILCDLPYGTTACKWDTIIPFEPLWKQYHRIAKERAAIVLTASQPFTSALVMSNVKNFKHQWVWNKAKAANFPQVKNHPLKVHEDVLVFSRGVGAYKPQMREGKLRRKGGYPTKHGKDAVNSGALAKVNNLYYPKSILDFSLASNAETGHPTQKPVALFEYMIKTYTNEGDLVLDNCAGSGTTAIAAENLGRRWVCIEQDQEYSRKAIERIKAQ